MAWREKNRETAREAVRKYDLAHRELRRQKAIARIRADPAVHNERGAKWKREHAERYGETTRKRRKERYAENPEPFRALDHRRRAFKLNSPGFHAAKETRDLLTTQGFICANPYCCADLRVVKRHLDHIVALTRGGSNGIDNLQWLCAPCNHRKKDIDKEAWLKREATRASAPAAG
jgi:5-methylcytosine-specific restriction endonuclease McrA